MAYRNARRHASDRERIDDVQRLSQGCHFGDDAGPRLHFPASPPQDRSSSLVPMPQISFRSDPQNPDRWRGYFWIPPASDTSISECQDQSASGGTVLACSTSCTDSGNNHRWSFTCGDGVVSGAETCDDGGTTSGDGCSASCTVESDSPAQARRTRALPPAATSITAGMESLTTATTTVTPQCRCRTNCGALRCGDGIQDSGGGDGRE